MNINLFFVLKSWICKKFSSFFDIPQATQKSISSWKTQAEQNWMPWLYFLIPPTTLLREHALTFCLSWQPVLFQLYVSLHIILCNHTQIYIHRYIHTVLACTLDLFDFFNFFIFHLIKYPRNLSTSVEKSTSFIYLCIFWSLFSTLKHPITKLLFHWCVFVSISSLSWRILCCTSL